MADWLRSIGTVLSLFCLLLIVTGCIPQPIRKPTATQPVPRVALDRSSPIATYRSYLQAIKAVDMEGAKSCWTFSGPGQARMLDFAAGIWVSSHRLTEAVLTHFGEPKGRLAEQLIRDDCRTEALDRTLARLSGARVEVSGDTARLYIKWQEGDSSRDPVFGSRSDSPIPFRRVSSDWLLDGDEETGHEAAETALAPGTWGSAFLFMVGLNNRLADQIESGKLRSIDEVAAEAKRQMGPFMKEYEAAHRERYHQHREATTRPAPSPAL